ncbi:MAG: fibronectin type III domain-containing protein, partial [Elusimicrobia bacterium]|nr:fibronectin type III domain-containing protein [Elusimicrobiota bacterium]
AITSGSFDSTNSSSGISGTGNTTLLLSNLTPNTTYTFQTRAVNFNNAPGTTTMITGSTATLPSIPGDISFTSISGTSITIAWSANNNPLTPPTSYQVQVSTWSGFSGTVTSSETFVIQMTTTGLTINSTYYFRVRTYGRTGETSAFNTAVSTLTMDTTAPAAITNLTATTSSTEGEISLSWTVPVEDFDNSSSGPPSSYDLRGGTFAFGESDFTNQTRYTISNGTMTTGQTIHTSIQSLTAGNTFYFRIKSLDESSNTSSIDTTTPQSSARAGLVAAGSIGGSVTQSNNQAITGVDVRADPESGTGSAATTNTGTDGSYRLSNLDRTLTYKVTVTWTVNQIKSSAFRTGISAQDSAALNFKLEVSYTLSTVRGQIALSPNVKETIRQAQRFATPGSSVPGPAFVELYQSGKMITKQHTDSEGQYSIPNLLPGIYQIRAYNGKSFSETQAIQLTGGDFSVSFRFALLPEKEVFNFPNPIRVPKDGAKTILRFESGAEQLDAEIKLYTLSGDLVRRIPMEEMKNVGTIYQYDWDLTNSNGHAVSAGIYFLQVRARDLKTNETAVVNKKIAIIR